MEQLEIQEQLKSMVLPILADLNLELVDLVFSRSRKSTLLRLLVDRPQGGINIDECALVNQRFAEALDNSAVLQENYLLEVSSPGLDRPLSTAKDFLRNQGRRVRVFLLTPVDNKIEIEGKIISASDEAVIVETQNTSREIPFQAISRGKLIL